jgi:hypothetical protein
MEILAGSFFLTVTRHMAELFVQETEKKGMKGIQKMKRSPSQGKLFREHFLFRVSERARGGQGSERVVRETD